MKTKPLSQTSLITRHFQERSSLLIRQLQMQIHSKGVCDMIKNSQSEILLKTVSDETL